MRIRIRVKVSKKQYEFIKKVYHPIRTWYTKVRSSHPYRLYTSAVFLVIVILTIFFRVSISEFLIRRIGGLSTQASAAYSGNVERESIEALVSEKHGPNVKGATTGTRTFQVQSDVGFVDLRVLTLEDFFNFYGSPLAEHSDDMIEACERYGVENWQLLPAIAINETNGCQTGKSYEQKNCWGWGGAGKNRWEFHTFEEAIDIITHRMINGYGNRRMNAKDIQGTYCGPNCMEYGWKWAKGVNYYVFRINDFGERYGLPRTNEIYNFDE
ncbi:hypothetical protein JW766_04245 [Candidatus Dojkabacteria bacterium]|nr:hypothetical protein [Candidatus Dojkabacteria bacterium]